MRVEMARNKAAVQIGLAVAGAMVVLFIGAVVAIAVYSAGASSVTTQNKSATALDGGNGNPIVKDFAVNPIAAEKKWIGNRVQIRNVVGKIDRDKDGWFVSFEHCDITTHIAKSDEDKFAKLKPGATVDVEFTLTKFTVSGDIPYLWGKDAKLLGVGVMRK